MRGFYFEQLHILSSSTRSPKLYENGLKYPSTLHYGEIGDIEYHYYVYNELERGANKEISETEFYLLLAKNNEIYESKCMSEEEKTNAFTLIRKAYLERKQVKLENLKINDIKDLPLNEYIDFVKDYGLSLWGEKWKSIAEKKSSK